MADDLLFNGLQVLDLGSWIAAPSAAAMLADMGAAVIKVEQPAAGDGYRQWYRQPRSPVCELNYAWALDNKNKRSLTLDLASEPGKAILHQLVTACDVYVTNQPLPMRRKLGLMWEDLQPLNPRMIYASLTPYGEQGPDTDHEAFDQVAYWARSGLMHQMRQKGIEPMQASPGLGDHPSGVALYASIVTALLKRERTGRGTKVHTSLLANGLWSAACLAQAAWADADFSQMPPPRLTRAVYETADHRWIQMSMVRTDEDFDRLLIALDRHGWLTDERFSTPERRDDNADLMTRMLRERIAQRTSGEWMTAFRAEGVPAVLVAEFHELMEEPQVLANDMAMEPVQDIGMPRLVRDPINVDGVGRVGAKRSPELGQHTDEILRELGYSPQRIQELRDQSVV